MNNLLDIWKEQPEGFLAVSSKTGDQWQDYFFNTVEEVNDWIKKNRDESDLYFCTTTLSKPKRVKENVQSSRFLWQDLDAVNPDKLPDNLRPTIAWESSPKRYQALWKLNTLYSADDIERLNQKLARTVKADKGSWILTKVLRIPGTYNFKYPSRPEVKLLWTDGPTYMYKSLQHQLGGLENDHESSSHETGLTQSSESSKQILAKHWDKLSTRIKELLMTREPPIGKRSDALWYLEHELIKAGLSLSQVHTVIKNSSWNKYKGRSDEEKRLTEEISKVFGEEVVHDEPAVDTEAEEGEEKPAVISLRLENDSEMMSNLGHYPGWLVEGFWTRKSHGIVSGEPKSFKSTLALDLAVSVASGKKFLNRFEVVERGPVLIVQNENAGWIMTDRLNKIRGSKGLVGKVEVKGNDIKVNWAPELPIYYVNQQGFSFSDPAHREIVEKIIKKINPKLVIFDPLYLMFEGDLSSSKDLAPILNWLLVIKERYNTSIMLIHHWKKNTQGTAIRSGQRMLGSTTLHGWIESAWYIETNGQNESDQEDQDQEPDFNPQDRPRPGHDESKKSTVMVDFNKAGQPVTLTLEREFRGAGVYPKMDISIDMGDFGDSTYNVKLDKHVAHKSDSTGGRHKKPSNPDLKQEIVDFILLKQGASARQIAEELGISKRKVNELLKEIHEDRQKPVPEVKPD